MLKLKVNKAGTKLIPILAALICVAAAGAAPLCTTMSAQNFAAEGGIGCQFGNTIFYNFGYTYTPGPNSAAVPDTAVTVTFTLDGADPNRPTVNFSANWDTKNEDISDIRINYQVATVPVLGVPIYMVAGFMNIGGNFGFQAPDTLGSLVSAAETVSLDNPGTGSASIDANILPTDPTPYGFMSTGSGDVGFSAQTQISISKDIQLFAGDAPDDANLTQISQGLQEVVGPEPGTYTTFGGAFIGLTFLLRKRAKAKV